VIKTIVEESTAWKKPSPGDEVAVTYSIKVGTGAGGAGVGAHGWRGGLGEASGAGRASRGERGGIRAGRGLT
jgi:hypothetical protein